MSTWACNARGCCIGLAAHYWARELMKLGHAVKLMAAQYVKAYVKGNKNDGNDAAAICEAVSRPGMHFVAINTEAQQDTQMLHRIRSRLVSIRTERAYVDWIRRFILFHGKRHPVEMGCHVATRDFFDHVNPEGRTPSDPGDLPCRRDLPDGSYGIGLFGALEKRIRRDVVALTRVSSLIFVLMPTVLDVVPSLRFLD